MYIVSKLICDTNDVEIIEVVDEIAKDMGLLVAFDSLIDDALQYDVKEHSIKNIAKNRVEVYYKGTFGNTLKYVYQIHATHYDDEKTEEGEVN